MSNSTNTPSLSLIDGAAYEFDTPTGIEGANGIYRKHDNRFYNGNGSTLASLVKNITLLTPEVK